MVKIRLARGGRTHLPIYRIVVADVRASRDGAFIEKIGTYNPHENPRRVDIDGTRTIYWLSQGAQLTTTVENLCRAKGIMLLWHLVQGLNKGAITKRTAQERFEAWEKRAIARKAPKVSFQRPIVAKEVIEELMTQLSHRSQKKQQSKS